MTGQRPWEPACHADVLQLRAKLRQSIRRFFDHRRYLEVDTPLLSHDVVIDAHLDPIETGVGGERLYLQTSPEAGMKRLLAAGSGSIWQLTRSFRQGELGALHNPEFVMLEWYGVATTWRDQMQLTEALVQQAATDLDASLKVRPADVLTYQQAFQRYVGIDPLVIEVQDLQQCVAEELDVPPPADRDDLLNLLLAEKIEPHLGRESPLFLIDYPASQAALAELSEDDDRVARRFELYVHGIEICNGYQELTDAEELHKREREQLQRRRQGGASQLPGAAMLLAAMEAGLTRCSGVALGFDRLLMLLTSQSTLDAVLPFPFDRA